jgi:hypothetical protein
MAEEAVGELEAEKKASVAEKAAEVNKTTGKKKRQ